MTGDDEISSREDPSSVIARDAAGDVLIEAELVASRFGVRPDDVRSLMARGLMVGRVERGQGRDEGRRRISIRSGNRVWRAILGAGGRIESERMIFVRPPPANAAASRKGAGAARATCAIKAGA